MSSIKKSFAGVMIAAFVFAGFATPAKAQTVAELQALVNQLMAQISAMSGGSNTNTCTGAYVHTVTLMQGSTGSQVAAMQGVIGAIADGKFGPATKAKVATFQSQNGLVADGVVGPATGAKLAMASTANCGGTSTPSTPGSSAGLEGTDGTINDVNELSQYNNEEVGEGEEDVIVLGFEVEATNDGDIMLNSVRVAMDPTTSSNDNLDDYVDEVTVWFGDKKVGSAGADDFSQNSSDVYTRTISLDGVKIDADETEKLYVAVSAVNSLDTGDLSTDAWVIDVDNIRFTDGSGVVTTEDGYDLGSMDVAMSFVDFGTAADTELKISTDSDSPEADVVMVDDSSDTDDVVLLKGKLRLEGTSDAVLDEMPVTFSPVGANLNEMVSSLKLKIGGEEYTESVISIVGGSSNSVTFDNLDLDIEAGDTVEFEVIVDVQDIDGSFTEGDTLEANVTSTNRDYIDVENEEGDQLSDSSEKSGTATGEAQEFRTEGIMVSLVSTSTDVTAGNSTNDDLGQFTIKFKVKAMGDSIYVSSLAAASLNTTGTGTVVGVERAGTATIGGVSVTVVNTTDDDLTAVGNYLIEDGEEETFEMTATVQLPTAGTAGQFRALIRAIDWSTTDVSTPTDTYTSNLDAFKTSYRALN